MKKIIVLGLLMSSIRLLAQSPVATTPFELFGDHIFIQLSVDGSEPMDFIFDSGSGITVIDTKAAVDLKLDLSHKESVAGAQASIDGARIKHNKVTMGAINIEGDVTLEAFDLNHLAISIGKKIDGIIGYDLLLHHVVKINYDDMILEVYNPDQFPKAGKKVGFTLHNSIPVIEAKATLNNEQIVNGTFYVNTGAGTSLDFNTPFANEKNIIEKTGNHYSYLVKGVENTESKHYEGRVKSFDMGFYVFTDMPVGISQTKGGLQGDKKISGIIGNKVLSRFNITFDYKNHNLYFEPNANAAKDFMVNCSGLDVQMSTDMTKVLIHQVQDEGPAKKAGVNSGDELISINEIATSSITLFEIEDLLKIPGSEVKLELKQGTSIKSVTLKLENLL